VGILVLVVFWLLAGRFGFRIANSVIQASQTRDDDHQFSIRDLMFLTALINIGLGIARAVLGGLTGGAMSGIQDGLLLFGLFGLNSALIAFPLVVVACASACRVFATVATLVAVAIITMLETHLLSAIRGASGWDDWIAISMTNVVQSAWILTVASVLRRAGYRMRSGKLHAKS
jgi:hypothetical protein